MTHTRFKVLFAGGFGAGKTTAVRSVSEIEPLTTEAELTEAGESVDSLTGVEAKTTTTVAFDFGRKTLPDPQFPVELMLFGMPGQERFSPFWYDICDGAVGAVILVDTRRLDTSFPSVTFCEQIGLPFIIAINHFNGSYEHNPADVLQALGLDPHTVPVMTLDARQTPQVAAALITLVSHALARFVASTLLEA
ncbi:ATP/GTP-binding protein [Streptomyces sp. NPDC005423]|uniref:GTP-binding protein n=1 Tax=Streptomyces sp. NPDC005423 TaxID=3155343 RepID=UPI0033AA5EFF